MKSFQYKYKGVSSFEKQLDIIKFERLRTPGCQVNFYITWTGSYRNSLMEIVRCIKAQFPDALYYGNEASASIFGGSLFSGIMITCSLFEDPDTRCKLLWVDDDSELSSLDDLWSYCKNEKGLKAVELIPSFGYVSAHKMDASTPDLDKDILIFGGASDNFDSGALEAGILGVGHPMTYSGMAVMLYYGENLHVAAGYILGWKGLGRLMKVTKSEGKFISEIDGAPAYSIYEKYLNLKNEDKDNLVFPLILDEDGIEYIRTPQAFQPDKSLRMFADIPRGSLIRIAYGDKNTILESLYEKLSDVTAFAPQAIKTYSCTARRLFWGDSEAHRETKPLNEIAPAGGFYSSGEILRFGDKLRVLNSTLVIAGFREGEGGVRKEKSELGLETNDKSLLSRITHFAEVVAKEQEEQHVQLEEALTMADSANHAKTEFLFNMSHDIRTPMNAILGFTSMAIKHIDDREKALDCLDKIQQSGELLLSLINSVLEVSRIESGKAALEEQKGDVYFSFTNIEDTMKVLAGTKGIDLSFEFGEVRDRFVCCDFSRCLRVFVNIISNSIKYTPEGGHVRVKCEQIESTRPGYGSYKYTFEDNGIGISEEFQKHVFEQFSREENVTKTGIQGTGLGLAVCKSFVELMGGTIECSSKPGEGTCFTVILPFKLQDGEYYTDPVTREVVSAAEAGNDFIHQYTHSPRDFLGKKVLLTEDNELNREIAVDILEEAGVTVDEAADGTEAVAFMKEKGPDYYDFLLMDIQMPVMNGYEATKAIREMYPDAKIPIIALSANAFAEDKAASIAAGMDAHVAKPINVNELFGCLAKYL